MLQYELPAHVDSTMMGTFSSCHQKFYDEFGLGLRPAETSVDLHAGGVFSATLERFYREFFRNGVDTPTALGRAYATFTSEWGGFVIRKEKHPKTPENMWAAVESYISTYPPRTDSVQPYFSDNTPSFEFAFAIPLDFPGFPRHPVSGDPFIYTGRFDLFGKLNGSTPCIRDEKTAQRLESNWAEKWDLRAQFLGYCWALQHLGIRCSTVVVRGVIITLKDVRQVEAIKVYPQFLIDRWFDQLRRNLIHLVVCHDEYMKRDGDPYRASAFDYNLGESCTAYSHCPFMPLCTSKDPESWYSTYSTKRWNPLNRNPLGDPSTIPLSFSGQIPAKYVGMISPEGQ